VRLRTLRLLAACVLWLAVSRTARAAVPVMVQGSIEPNDRRVVYITFDAPLPAPDDVMRAAFWELIISAENGSFRTSTDGVAIKTCSTFVALHGFINRCPPGESIVEVALQLTQPVPDPVRQVDILYVGPSGTATLAMSDRFELALGRSADAPVTVANIDEADIYVDGKYTRVVDQGAAFDIDAYAGYMRAIAPGSPRYWGRAGAYGQLRAKDSPNGDPDSLLLYGVYQRVLGTGQFYGPLQSPIFNLRAPGFEIERNGDQQNLVVSPVITVPVRLSRGALGPIQPGIVYPQMTVFAGTEIVKPLASADESDTGWRSRALFGATVTAGIAPEQPWLQSLTVRAGYQLRLLSGPEIFRTADSDGFELGAQARHRAEISLTYFPVKWTGLSFDYEYGGVPPVFFIAGHTFTAGITFTLKQTSYGRLSILTP
jgi:hypothetical protein